MRQMTSSKMTSDELRKILALKPLSKMTCNELREILAALGYDKRKTYGTGKNALIYLVIKIRAKGGMVA